MSRRVLRYEVPVDDQWHEIEVQGDVAHVGCRQADVVEFWAVDPVQANRITNGLGELIRETFHDVPTKPLRRRFRVFGTGQLIDEGLYVGTTYAAGGSLVWHLFVADVAREGDRG